MNAPKTSGETKEFAAAFIKQIEERNRIHLLPFDPRRWFVGAYSTLQRTLRDEYAPLNLEQKARLQEKLFTELQRDRDLPLSAQEAIISDISLEYRISIGHAQKLVGMLCKYSFAVGHFAPTSVPVGISRFLAANTATLPIPIDNFVLEALFRDHRDRFGDIVKRGTIYKLQEGGVESSWSRLKSVAIWRSLQERIQELAAALSQSPMEYEMRHLWVAKPLKIDH